MSTSRQLVIWSGAILAIGSAPADPYPRNVDLDVIGYRYHLAVTDSSDLIRMEAAIAFRFLAAGRTRLTLDLVGRGDSGRGMVVDQVADSAGPLTFTHQANRLDVSLRRPGRSGERSSLSIRYHGVPAAALKIGPNKSGARTFSSDNWPDLARHWLVGVDHPYDKATSEFIVTAPAHYQVVSNGLMVEETDLGGGFRRTHWRQSAPIATWLQTLGVARYAVQHSGTVDGTPIQAWAYPADRERAFADFGGPTKAALRFYNEWVGPYAYEKLANVESVAAGGGMEAATAIGYTERLIGTARVREVVVHEIAHQWFGNAVTESDWNDVWLSEGFATYFTLLFTEHDAGRDAFVEGLLKSRATVLEYDAKHPGYRVVHANLTDMSEVTSSQTYQKGAWTLHMLRGLIGTDTFWRGIREYYHRYRDANATTEDFRRIMEAASGKELDWFFRQWLTRSGAPKLEGGWRYDPVAKRIEISLDQTQAGEPFRVPLEIGIRFPGESAMRIERVEITGGQARFSFDSPREPASVTLDPNLWVLMESRFDRRP